MDKELYNIVENLIRYHYDTNDIVVKTKQDTNEAKIVAKNNNLYIVIKKLNGPDGHAQWAMYVTARELTQDPYKEWPWAIKFRTDALWELEAMIESTSTVYDIVLSLMDEKYRNKTAIQTRRQKNNGKYYFPFKTYRRDASLHAGILEMYRCSATNNPINVYLNKDKAEEAARRMLFDDDDSNVICIDTSGEVCMAWTIGKPNMRFFVDRKCTEHFFVES